MGADPDAVQDLLAQDAQLRALARRLVTDPDVADDVTQDAWLVAATRKARGVPPPFGWLARVVRNLSLHVGRGDARRSGRERAAARDEALPPTDEAVQRVEMRRRLIEAVLALEEPFRTTTILRYFENEPPRRIAARLAVPVETVRSRLKRALALLRAKLDRDHGGDRRASFALLASLAGLNVPAATAAGAATAATTVAIGGLLMKTKWALACVVVALLAGPLVVLWPRERENVAPRSESVDAGAARSAFERGLVVPAGVEPAATEPHSAIVPRRVGEGPDSTAAGFGTVIVRAVWMSDRTPATGVRMRFSPFMRAEGSSDSMTRRTDSAGVCRADRVPSGTVMIDPMFGSQKLVQLPAGETVDETIEIAEGAVITGSVVTPEGAGVADAEIWLSAWQRAWDGDVVTRSTAGGFFRIRGVQHDDRRYVGARAPGHAASNLVRLSWWATQWNVTLIIQPSPGALRGRVFAPDGTPVAGAVVHAGGAGFQEERPYSDDRVLSATFETSTDAQGAFAIEGVAAGELALIVRAKGRAPWFGSAAIRANETTTVSATLTTGATLRGVVVDEAGMPLAGVTVHKQPWDWLVPYAKTDEKGGFRIVGLASGAMALEADGGAIGKTAATVNLAPGQETFVQLTLSRGLAITGRVVDERGAPIPGCRVHIDSSTGNAAETQPDFRSVETGPDGGFAFGRCLDTEYRVRAYEPDARVDSIRLEHVKPGPEPIVLKIADAARATAFVKGRVLGADGAPITDARVALMRGHGGPQHAVVADGSFRAGPVPPGDYELCIGSPGVQFQIYAARITVSVGETLELGAIRIQSRLVVRVSVDDGRLSHAVWGSFRQTNGFSSGDLVFEDGVAKTRTLPPGPYDLSLHGEDVMPLVMHVDVRADEETIVDVQLRAGAAQVLEISDAAEGPRCATVLIHVTTSDGTRVGEVRFKMPEQGPLQYFLVLAPGTYTLDATSDTNRTLATTFTVTAAPRGADKPFSFTLR